MISTDSLYLMKCTLPCGTKIYADPKDNLVTGTIPCTTWRYIDTSTGIVDEYYWEISKHPNGTYRVFGLDREFDNLSWALASAIEAFGLPESLEYSLALTIRKSTDV